MNSLVADGLLDVSDCVDDCSLEMCLVRFHAPAINKGRIAASFVEEEVTILGSMQPVSASELRRLPEGLRVDGVYHLYTATEVRAGDQDTGRPPDQIEFEDVRYEVQQVNDWRSVGGYYKAVVRRRNR